MSRVGIGLGLGLMTAMVLLAACSSTSGVVKPTPSPVVSPSPVAVADVLAVANKIWMGSSGAPCKAETIATCPVSQKLATQIKTIEGGKASAFAIWCRCKDVQSLTIKPEATKTGGTAHVVFDKTVNVDWVMVYENGALVVDDIQCGGKGMSTSIYIQPVVSCS